MTGVHIRHLRMARKGTQQGLKLVYAVVRAVVSAGGNETQCFHANEQVPRRSERLRCQGRTPLPETGCTKLMRNFSQEYITFA
jgi:hypothetical protein